MYYRLPLAAPYMTFRPGNNFGSFQIGFWLTWGIFHTLPSSGVKKQDFRTGGSVKNHFPHWSEIPNWFRTIQNWVGTTQTIAKTPSDLVSYWWDQQHAVTKVSYLWFRLFVLLGLWNSSFRTEPVVVVLFELVGAKVCIDVWMNLENMISQEIWRHSQWSRWMQATRCRLLSWYRSRHGLLTDCSLCLTLTASIGWSSCT